MADINTDSEVMMFFPKLQNIQETKDFIECMQKQYRDKGFCYFAVDRLSDKTFIGFIGLSEQTYESDFTPCIDIGWRLSQKEWGKGYATEGAKRCLDFAFEELNLKNIKAICPVLNKASEQVMQKIGMTKNYIFKHSLLKENKTLKSCLLYEIKKQ